MPLCSGITWTRCEDADSNCCCVIQEKAAWLEAISTYLKCVSLAHNRAILLLIEWYSLRNYKCKKG